MPAIAAVNETCSSRSRIRGGLISDGTSTAAGPSPPWSRNAAPRTRAISGLGGGRSRRGEDITRQVLTQIIVDEEAGGGTMLPINFLKQLIGLYGNSMQNFVPQYLEAAMDAFQRNQSAAKDAFSGNIFADLAKRNMAMLGDAAEAFTGKKAEPKPKAASSTGGSDMDQLKAELG